MKHPSRILAPLLTTFLLAIGSAPATAQESPTPSRDKLTFVVGTTDDISSPNPFFATTTSTDYEMLFLSYDMLLNFDQATLQPAPGIAESWEVSEDGTTYTFKIREGMTWSDGKPVTARDVEFTYDFIMNNEGTGAFKNYLGDPKDFRAVDDTTFEWEMGTPTMAPLTPPYIPILPEHYWSKLDGADAGTIKGDKGMPQIGSGPFELVEWERGQFVRFQARDEYWMGTPHVDEVVFRIFQNQEAMVQALKEGEVDAVNNLVPTLYDSLQGTPGITTLETSAAQVYNLALNLTPDSEHWVGTEPEWHKDSQSTGSEALMNPSVRKAIALAMNKQELVDKVLGGHGEPADSFILPVFSQWYMPAPDELVYRPQEMEKAKALMDQAGYKDTDGDGIREMPDGTPLEFDLLVLANNESSNGAGKYVKEWLTELGWKVNLKALGGGKITSLWYDSDYDGYIWYWTGDPDPDFMLSIFTSGQCLVWSDTCWSTPEYDKLYEKQRKETDPVARGELVDQMQQIYYEEVPEIMLFYTKDLQAVRTDKWQGFQHSPEPSGGYIYAWGPFSYINLQPAVGAENAPSGESGGSNAVLYVGIALILLIGIGLALRARGRRAEDDA